jgi:hypothetical protein
MEEQNPVQEKTNKLPAWLITVTPLSKALAMILFIALPFLGFYLGIQYQQKITIPTPTVTVNPTNTPSPTVTYTPLINTNNSESVQQNGITMTISPTKGPAGTKVKISIVGIIGNPNAPYANISFLAKNGIGQDSQTNTYTVNTTKINQSGAYETTYIIPNTVLTSANPDAQSPSKEVPIEVGNGTINFSYQHPTLGDISIKAPFTVTSD